MLFFIEVHAKGKARSYKNLLFKFVVAFGATSIIGTLQSILLRAIALFRSCKTQTPNPKSEDSEKLVGNKNS